MGPLTVTLIVGISILIIDRIYDWSATIIKSHCCCINITPVSGDSTRDKSKEINTNNDFKSISQMEK